MIEEGFKKLNWECKGQQLYTKVKVASFFTDYFFRGLRLTETIVLGRQDVLIIYYLVTNYHKFCSLKQHTYLTIYID